MLFFGLGVGIWVYNVDPNPPSEATFVLLMFVGSAILIYSGGMVRPVRHFRQEEHHWTLSPNKRRGHPMG